MIRGGIRRAFHLALRRRDRWEDDVEEEIKFHLALRAEALVAAGASNDDAYAEAVRRFGPLAESRARMLDAARHRETRMQRVEYLSDLTQDLRFAIRTLRRQPAWTAVTIVTLALGIGATTAVFSVISSLLLHPVPYPSADRVVFVDEQPSMGNMTGMSVSVLPSAEVARAWTESSHSFEALDAYQDAGDGWLGSGADDADRVHLARIVPGFATFAGVRPIVGRMFTEQEARGHVHVALIGEALWRTRFSDSEAVAGEQLVVDDSTYTIVGVLPSAARLPRPGAPAPDVWLPLDIHGDVVAVSLVGRLRRGVTIARAISELDSIYARSGAKATSLKWTTRIVSPSQLLHYHDTLIMLMASVALVLLVACANVAHLQLSRGAARARELAIRAAVGAGRARLLRQLVTESILISAAGAIGGMGLGWAGLRVIIARRPDSLGELSAAHIDGTTLLLTVAVGAVSGIAFGIIGAVNAGRQSTHEALKAGALSASRSRTSERLRGALVVSEMALSMLLLVGATLLVRSVIRMQRTDLGFDAAGLYTVEVDFPKGRYAERAQREEFAAELQDRVAHLNGVRSTAVAHVGPSGRAFAIGALEVEGEPPAPTGQTSFIDQNDVSPAYFRTLGMRLVEGTTFTDTSENGNQVVVNEGFARKHWATGSAVGHRIRIGFQGQGTWLTIVGVTGEASTNGPLGDRTAPFLYLPNHGSNESLALYFRVAPGSTAPADSRNVVRAIDRSLHPTVRSVADAVRDSTAAPRFVMLLLSAFTGLALALASIGLYGVMAHGVAQQTREIGIRVALGATSGRIARRVIVRGLGFAVLGATIGLVGSRWATALIAGELYGVSRFDALSLAAGTFALVAAAALACVVPTRRALAVDPMTAIRAD